MPPSLPAATTAVAIAFATGAAADPLTSLVVEDATGARKTLRAHVGDAPVVLHLWATWCSPCRIELPVLDEALAAAPQLAEGVVLLSVDTRDPADVRAFLADELGVATPTLTVDEGSAGDVLGVKGYPTTLLVEPDGTIAGRHQGILDWKDEALKGGLNNFLQTDGATAR